MTLKKLWRSGCAFTAALAVAQPGMLAMAAPASGLYTVQPRSSAVVASFASNPSREITLSHAQKLALLRHHIKYVFVLFQENRSFDFHFGTFPGAHGLFSQPASQTPGFSQDIMDCATCANPGQVYQTSTFLIPQTVLNTDGQTVQIYPADTISVDHSHAGLINSLDLQNGAFQNDRYALDEEGLTTNAQGQVVSLATGMPVTTYPTLAAKQKAEIALAHDDCDTVPFMWQYASRFTLMDNFYMGIIGPSTPNALSLFAGQSGITQWALHPNEGSNNTGSPVVQESGGEPVVSDVGPFPGSNLDQSPVKPPYNPGDENPAKPGLNQTYASLGLSFMQKDANKIIQSDENPALDLADVQNDIKTLTTTGHMPVNWGWYQEGYDHEPTDGDNPASHATYVIHHDAPQYFGYLGDNTIEQNNLHGLNDFFVAVQNQALPSTGGVFYVRGGYGNNDGLLPVDPDSAVQAAFQGSDDHASYSDTQISESLLADEVNAIAASPYWSESAIIITYDETDGDYDQMQPKMRQLDPEGNPLAPGPRIPAIIISPYAEAHVVDHDYSEHGSVIKFIDELFNLTPLAGLPDEKRAAVLGKKEFGQDTLLPSDSSRFSSGDLFSAFDNNRLAGKASPLPASYAEIPEAAVTSLPHYASTGGGCYTLNIVPTDYVNGKLLDPAPADFNPRPTLTPGIPTQPGWTP